jgi:hypothetical protein
MIGWRSLKNKRVRKHGQSLCGTVVGDDGEETVRVIWDDMARWITRCDRDILIVVESEPVGVPEEARPYSVGALSNPERRFV